MMRCTSRCARYPSSHSHISTSIFRIHICVKVAALDFSADGSLVLAMAGGDGQTLNILDWRDGVRLVTARAESSLLCAYSIRFNPYLYLSGKRAEAAGLAPGEACYTLVSCGQRHVRFWKLTRAWCPRIPRESSGFGENSQGRGRGEEGEGVGGWMWSLNSKPGNFGGRGDMENMTCMAFIGETSDEPSTSVGGGARLPLARTVTGTESGQVSTRSPFSFLCARGYVLPLRCNSVLSDGSDGRISLLVLFGISTCLIFIGKRQ